MIRQKQHSFLRYVSLIVLFITISCYKGVSKNDEVRIVEAEVSSSRRVAMLIKRSDHAALSGNTFFVIISDRVLTIPELRSRLYALNSVFVSGLDGLSLRWSAPNELTVQCQRCEITRDIVEKQLFALNGVKVTYTGFPW